ncbi:MAG: DUF433 domain-containing protein [Acidobacteria bacterium]|nr:DUF433 domain-containing protein [Acidobacteriota bacterium]
MLATIQEHVEVTPGVCGGKPRVAGHRIRVADIAVLHQRSGKTPDEIAELYPSLSLADIHAALAYYFDHRPEIDADILSDQVLADEARLERTSRLAFES